MDLTIEAIENDLLLAEQNIGRPGYDLHLTRAKVRATLVTKIDTGPSTNPISITETDVDIRVLEGGFGTVYVVPKAAVFEDRFTIATQVVATSGDQIDAWILKRSATEQDRLELAGKLLGVDWDVISIGGKEASEPQHDAETIPPNFGWPTDEPGAKEPDDEDDIFADAKRERRK